MFGSTGLARTGNLRADGLRAELERVREELASLRAGAPTNATGAGNRSLAALRASAAEKIDQGANLTRAEAAAHIGVSTRMLQRMEGAKVNPLPRCAGLGTVVRYAPRDVLRIAPAYRKER